jgi:hypothetical protein
MHGSGIFCPATSDSPAGDNVGAVGTIGLAGKVKMCLEILSGRPVGAAAQRLQEPQRCTNAAASSNQPAAKSLRHPAGNSNNAHCTALHCNAHCGRAANYDVSWIHFLCTDLIAPVQS